MAIKKKKDGWRKKCTFKKAGLRITAKGQDEHLPSAKCGWLQLNVGGLSATLSGKCLCRVVK